MDRIAFVKKMDYSFFTIILSAENGRQREGKEDGMDITGRKLFVKALQEEGVTTLFGYPGGTVTDLLMNYISRMVSKSSYRVMSRG